MSANFQAIINGARADAPGTGRGCPRLVIRPRDRRPALAIRQDAEAFRFSRRRTGSTTVERSFRVNS